MPLVPTWLLVPSVIDLAVTYQPGTGTLTVYGKSDYAGVLYSPSFVRDSHFVGGFKVSFMGWVGPALEKPQDYPWTQSFNVPYVPGVMTLDKIVVCDAAHPDGVLVDVKWLGINKPPVADEKSNGVAIPRPHNLTEFMGRLFEIRAQALSSGVTIQYDNKNLVLTNCSIIEGEMVWTFLPVSLGSSHITVTYTQHVPIIGNQEIYDVNVLLSPFATRDANGPSSNEILGFLGGVNIAVRQVREKYPKAELFRVTCDPPIGPVYPRINGNDLHRNTAYFRADNGVVTIKDVGWWSIWGQPVWTEGPILGPGDIPWPPEKEYMDLDKAAKLVVEASKMSFFNAELWAPMNPTGDTQPRYSFSMLDASTWEVGAIDGKVFPPEKEEGKAK